MKNLKKSHSDIQNQVNKNLNDIDQAYSLTKAFTQHFDQHLSKVNSLVLSLLETDAESLEQQSLPHQRANIDKRITFSFEPGMNFKKSSNPT